MFRKVLHRNGKRVLNRSISPHLLRKSSATYYAGILKNAYKMNARYGWRMTSNVGESYISDKGIPEEETVEVVERNKMVELEKKIGVLESKLDEIYGPIKKSGLPLKIYKK
jgi:hypothetical protein